MSPSFLQPAKAFLWLTSAIVGLDVCVTRSYLENLASKKSFQLVPVYERVEAPALERRSWRQFHKYPPLLSWEVKLATSGWRTSRRVISALQQDTSEFLTNTHRAQDRCCSMNRSRTGTTTSADRSYPVYESDADKLPFDVAGILAEGKRVSERAILGGDNHCTHASRHATTPNA